MDQNQQKKPEKSEQELQAQRIEKARKKYLRAVRRKLALSGLRRRQAMKALSEEIPREAESAGDIAAALGTPGAYADRLNHSREGWVYSKNPWRFLFLALGILGAGALIFDQVLRLMALIQSSRVWQLLSGGPASVGVIGGADGPTAIFVNSPSLWYLIPWALLAVTGFVGYYCLRHWKTQNTN